MSEFRNDERNLLNDEDYKYFLRFMATLFLLVLVILATITILRI
jgi:hypothetical protein